MFKWYPVDIGSAFNEEVIGFTTVYKDGIIKILHFEKCKYILFSDNPATPDLCNRSLQ